MRCLATEDSNRCPSVRITSPRERADDVTLQEDAGGNGGGLNIRGCTRGVVGETKGDIRSPFCCRRDEREIDAPRRNNGEVERESYPRLRRLAINARLNLRNKRRVVSSSALRGGLKVERPCARGKNAINAPRIPSHRGHICAEINRDAIHAREPIEHRETAADRPSIAAPVPIPFPFHFVLIRFRKTRLSKRRSPARFY